MKTSSTTRTLDNNSYATNPGRLTVAHRKLRVLRPDLYGVSGFVHWLTAKFRSKPNHKLYITEQLQFGASNPAIVASTSPLLIAAYAFDLGAIAMLQFPESLAKSHKLELNTRLLSINTYRNATAFDTDLDIVKERYRKWTGFHPIIADFVVNDDSALALRKSEIAEELWALTADLARDYLRKHPNMARDGRPVFASIPACRG